MKKFKRWCLLALSMLILILFSCAGDDGAIAVISREEGSGTRDAFQAFVEINLEEDRSDAMAIRTIIASGNGEVTTIVRRNDVAIGYVSFATFINQGEALVGLYINGYAPTVENILAGNYQLARQFNFVYMEENIGDIERAFIAFAQSIEGLEVLTGMGAVVDDSEALPFDASAYGRLSGTVAFGGSTSTEATALALAEEFRAIFPSVEITYDATGSGAGITGAVEGTYTIGFASREIRDTELATGIATVTYCLDGMVIVVHPDNPAGITGLTIDQLRDVWLGEVTSWFDLP